MPARLRQLAILFTAALLLGALSGCGTINEKMSAGMADYIPAWAGGLPADAPPRPGTAKYDEYMASANGCGRYRPPSVPARSSRRRSSSRGNNSNPAAAERAGSGAPVRA